MFCAKCGTALKEGSMFCGKCGAKVGSTNAEIKQEPSNYQQSGFNPNQSMGPNTTANKKNKSSVLSVLETIISLIVIIVAIIIATGNSSVITSIFSPGVRLAKEAYQAHLEEQRNPDNISDYQRTVNILERAALLSDKELERFYKELSRLMPDDEQTSMPDDTPTDRLFNN